MDATNENGFERFRQVGIHATRRLKRPGGDGRQYGYQRVPFEGADPHARGFTLGNVLAQEEAALLLAGGDDYF